MKYVVSLKNELGLFFMVLLVAILLVGGVYLYRQSLIEDMNLAEARLSNIQKKYQQAKDRSRLMQEYREKFALLKDSNIIGDENRLNWIDSLDRIIEQEQIPYLKYRISQQRPFNDRKLLNQYPDIKVFQSPMDLEMNLLHEGDLFAIINNLDAKAKGLFDVEQCSIERSKRLEASVLESKTDSNFKAKCALNWYTFQPQGS
jgi:hypothetical protein